MDADFRPFSLSLARPLETAAGPIDHREGFLVSVAADVAGRVDRGDVVGTGEATPLPGWTEDVGTCREELEAALARLRDCSLDDAVEEREAVLPDHDVAPAARHGLDLALVDLEARREDVPLYKRLGAVDRIDSVPVNAVIGAEARKETVAAAEAAVAAGFECLKLKVGSSPVEDDVERVMAVREAVGPDVTLRADANGAWSRGQARRAFDELWAADVEYVEQPLPPDDLEGAAALRGGPVGVAADETLARYSPVTVLESGAADVLIVKPMVLGGTSRARAVASVARGADVDAVVTTTLDGVVARVGAVHLAASLPDPSTAGLATSGWIADDLAPDPITVVAGRASVPQTPGHGVDVEEGST